MGALGNRKGLKKIQVSQALNILPPHQDLPNYKKKTPFRYPVYKYSVWFFILSLPLPVTDFVDICSMTVKKVSNQGKHNGLKMVNKASRASL